MIHHKIHHHATRAVHHLRGRPKHEREHVARIVAFVSMGVLFVAWGAWYTYHVSHMIAQMTPPPKQHTAVAQQQAQPAQQPADAQTASVAAALAASVGTTTTDAATSSDTTTDEGINVIHLAHPQQ